MRRPLHPSFPFGGRVPLGERSRYNVIRHYHKIKSIRRRHFVSQHSEAPGARVCVKVVEFSHEQFPLCRTVGKAGAQEKSAASEQFSFDFTFNDHHRGSISSVAKEGRDY